MIRVNVTRFRMAARLGLAVLAVSVAGYTPYMRTAQAGPTVPPTLSTVMGQDLACYLYAGWFGCIFNSLCCTNPYQILDGDIKNKLEPWIQGFYNIEMDVRWRAMADQWTAAILMNARALGGFYDGQNFQDAMLSQQKLNAQSLRDYTVDEQLCRFGTAARSLGNSEMRGQRASLMLSERAQNRHMVNLNSNAANTEERGREPGRAADKSGRRKTFIDTFCNKSDENFALASATERINGADVTCSAADQNLNRDINYARSFEMPTTLDLTYSGTTPADDLRNLMALGSNLYAHDIIVNRPNASMLDPGNPGSDAMRWLAYRSVLAKRSVAQNSFNKIGGMKTKGSDASTQYLRVLLKELGMTDDDITRTLGEAEPSYYAQMEILTKKIYQNPKFFADLMQTPANISRTQTAMKAIGLMQERDIADSLQRSEMLFSTLLELQLARAQSKILDRSAR